MKLFRIPLFSSAIFILGVILIGHGGYKLYLRDVAENILDQNYKDTLLAIARNEMPEVRRASKRFISLAPVDDPRLAQVQSFYNEAITDGVISETRQGNTEEVSQLLEELQQVETMLVVTGKDPDDG